MTPSTKGLGHYPFTVEMLGSNPAGATILYLCKDPYSNLNFKGVANIKHLDRGLD